MNGTLFRLIIVESILLITVRLQAATFTYSYDPLNRLTNAAYSDGSRESYSLDPAGNRLSRVTLAAISPSDVTPPSIPTNLVWTAFTPSQLRIAWNRSFDTGGSGLAGYQVYVNGTSVATTTDTNFSLSALFPNSQYCLSVVAYDHSGNASAQSTELCRTTPIFQPPLLSGLGFVSGQFQAGIAGGTVGPYDIFVSTNLTDWQFWTNLVLPVPGNMFVDPAAGMFDQHFYQLRWSTNWISPP